MSLSDRQLSETKLSSRTYQAVISGIESWQQSRSANGPRDTASMNGGATERKASADFFVSFPRRQIKTKQGDRISLPIEQPVRFKTSRIRALGRLFIWGYILLFFILGTLWDRLLGRDSEGRRAVRLRRAFEKAGGTFVKLGQQLSMRVDFLPWAYTVELAKMLDQVPPFPLEQAIEAIERSTGQPLQETFAVFDPEPIGSASVANVYQAILKTGEKVAVKVRRPGIGEVFMADFKVMDWFLDLAEFMTLIRPGYTRNLRAEFQNTLLEELDFIQEAHFQDMFRRNAKKSGKKFFTAPKVYFELSNREVVVEGYTAGIWLWEIMAAVEQNNLQAWALMHQLNIEPKKVAERLLWVNYWGMQENLIFHADPHPANVIVGRNSKLTFIDFGSCGSFNRDQRTGLELMAVASGNQDPEGMARGSMKLIEPLPPLDVNQVFEEIEAEFTRVLAILKNSRRQSEWWERTSVLQWITFFKYSRANKIPVAIHTLRMIRATLLYDTVAVRIHKEIDRFDEYLRFLKYREKRAKKRVTNTINRQIRKGVDDTLFLRLEEASATAEKLVFRTQSLLSSPLFKFGSLIGKWVFVAFMGIRILGRLLAFTLISGLVVTGFQLAAGGAVDVDEIARLTLTNRLYQVLLGIIVLIDIRRIFFRLGDHEN